ncbi:MAG TPA: excinuclease ABC subunit UvrB [Candidatus Limnocylindrales bacterium]|nr:excinuclease ABC subunit UvrB [Candidatus Limnocylindrales bacterium]
MPDFRLEAPFQPTGDQPQAIEKLVDGLGRGLKFQTLLGATGTGKTYTIAQTIARHNRPTLVLAHNKTLAAQLYSEFREFFPHNAVEYFVSYFDYYQPEAYLPRSDTYIEKDSSRNDEIDKLRHAATRALFERRDTIIVASVSCIYGLGAPVDYGATVVRIRVGGRYRRDGVLRQLVDLQYQRNDAALSRARFRVRGDTLELQPAYDDYVVRVNFFGDEVERITEVDPLTGEVLAERNELNVYPASHYVTPAEKMHAALVDIEEEMKQRVAELQAKGMELEAERLRQRTTFDVEMMRELGFCSGIENYSRHLSRRSPGSRPWTLLDYFPPDWLLVVDESHMTIPQVVGMYKNDRTRKEILVDFGFRLPSALDNRPLTFEEFEDHLNQVVFMSATPGPYELQRSERVAEQLIRPTGVVDPQISVQPTEGQIDDLLDRIKDRVDRGERVLVTTLTKKMAEDLADYLHEMGVRVSYLHSEVDTLERVQILRDLRLGVYDVLVGINLLREGIDLPEVTLVAILDADKEGFLRSAWSLIQVIGRAARNIGGEVVMYADRVTESMQVAIEETNRRREIQQRYNEEHGIVPQTIIKDIRDINDRLRAVAEAGAEYAGEKRARELSEMSKEQVGKLVAQLETEMRAAARELEFERAAALRDEIQSIRQRVLEEDESVRIGRAAERAAAQAGSAGRATSPAEEGSAALGGGSAGLGGGRSVPSAKPSERAAARRAGERRGRRALREGEADLAGLEVTAITVVPVSDDSPAMAVAGHGHGDGHDHGHGEGPVDEGTAADWLPGIRDEHEGDDAGWMARWLDRPTWDHRVTPNVVKRTGERPTRRQGGRWRG